jgi:arylsulfatase
MDVWAEPFVMLRAPTLIDLRADPFERAKEESNLYGEWMFRRLFVIVPAQAGVAQFLETFKEFPPRQKPASFSIDQALEKMKQGMGGSK